MKIVYEIEILGWELYNKKNTKNMRSVMISKRFFDDVKIQMLPPTGKLLYLFLLLRRGDHDTNLFRCSHEDCVNSAGGRGVLVSNLLDQLQSFQLLKYQKIAPNIIELNIIKENLIKLKLSPPESKAKKPPEEKEENRRIWESYFNAFRSRYGVDPVRNASVNAQVSGIRKRLGVEDAIKVVKFFVGHNDSFYLKNTHSFGLCLSNCESLRTQMLRNTPITGTIVKQFEKQVEKIERDKQIERMFLDDEPERKE